MKVMEDNSDCLEIVNGDTLSGGNVDLLFFNWNIFYVDPQSRTRIPI